MFRRLVCNDRNNAMENWRKDDLMNERSSFSHFFPPRLITAQIINSMPLSIDGGCHTSRRRPLPHKDTQPRSVFRLLQRCRSEVGTGWRRRQQSLSEATPPRFTSGTLRLSSALPGSFSSDPRASDKVGTWKALGKVWRAGRTRWRTRPLQIVELTQLCPRVGWKDAG